MTTQNEDAVIIVDSLSENGNNVQQTQENTNDLRKRHNLGSGSDSERCTQNPRSGNVKGEKFGHERLFRINFEGNPAAQMLPPHRQPNNFRAKTIDGRIAEKLAQMTGPTFDIPPLEIKEKKFSVRNRLYIGNLPLDVPERDVKELLKRFGETTELFLNKGKRSGFIHLDFRVNAEKAKNELDGSIWKGHILRIRFASSGSAIKVKNLTGFVTNELLYWAFSVFGEIERSVVIVDDRGKPTGEGIVEYTRKGFASLAIRKCAEGCFLLTSSLHPVIVEPYDEVDDSDGYQEKHLIRNGRDYKKSREIGPRFANYNSFQFEYGRKWKQLYKLHAEKEDALKREFKMEKENLEAQMEYAKLEYETEMLRSQLRNRDIECERQRRKWELKERQVEESLRSEEEMKHQQQELQATVMQQEAELRSRQQENILFMQAHQLDKMLDQQERGTFNNMLPDMAPAGNIPMDPTLFMSAYDLNQRFHGQGMRQLGPRGIVNMRGRGPWSNRNRGGIGGGNRNDFPNKKRRY